MNAFEIRGNRPLQGSISPQGAKNEALQVLCAALLTNEPVHYSNVPDIVDVNLLIELLSDMGVKVTRGKKGEITLQADEIDVDYFSGQTFKRKSGKLRGAVMVAGPMLARFRKAQIPQPGGDKIGRRRLDTHIRGFERLGVRFSYDEEQYLFHLSAEQLRGGYILMDEPSVTGTANILMAAVLAEGETTLYNAACEPYVQQLCRLLHAMGACISGIGSNCLQVKGVAVLHGARHRLLADMIEVGSFIGLAAMTGSDITVRNADVAHLGIIPETFRKLGIQLEISGDDIHIPKQDSYQIQSFIDGSVLTIYDHPWPGFTPDLLSIVLVVATQARGTVLVHQKMFESRLFFVDKLIDMGAQIVLCDPHRAVVIGLDHSHSLRGINMVSPDIRAGQALLIAALSARGKSTIQNIGQIDRGYERIDERLNALGADIRRA
ncbi:MAG: UDP-N-acetylglucosamine 1-carboxyvinyltransferase [Bacteroidetes bacterium]|nr:UDP-N-acetylglucosamine 1-carboxyvinyltransferase [Bacteroidota bacterium]MBS1630461.1 UDP-N-acetylglucosamine 1-carboxyvinyltransferase [Bacteroidota bacterium]